ncbi:MAG: complex I NDUFA9 subunit family protein [Rhodospirillaceae bacterium]|nr:complex I NDUFA9 subunit family protein [Rhodospirillaceae bacterium]
MVRRVVTVFGGSGFIGRYVVQRLAAEGAIVRVAVRDVEAAAFLKPLGDIGQIIPFPANITDPLSVARALAGATEAVNLVGILSEWGKNTFQRVHVDGAANVATAARQAGVRRLVHVSALGADTESASIYARTKAAGEAAVLEAFPGATIIRPAVVFGPEDKFFNLFAGIARLSPVLPVFGCPLIPKVTLFGLDAPVDLDFYGDGGTFMQPVYVDDIAKAVINILGDSQTAAKTFELGGPSVYSFTELMRLVCAQSGRSRILLPVPFFWASFWGWFLEKLPKPLLTRDQVRLLKADNLVADEALGFEALGIHPAAAEAVLPTYLHRYRPPARRHLREA